VRITIALFITLIITILLLLILTLPTLSPRQLRPLPRGTLFTPLRCLLLALHETLSKRGTSVIDDHVLSHTITVMVLEIDAYGARK
jgi:hypothetical protein